MSGLEVFFSYGKRNMNDPEVYNLYGQGQGQAMVKHKNKLFYVLKDP